MFRILVLSWGLLNFDCLSFKYVYFSISYVCQNHDVLFGLLWREIFVATFCYGSWKCCIRMAMLELWNDKYVLCRLISLDAFLSERLLKASHANWKLVCKVVDICNIIDDSLDFRIAHSFIFGVLWPHWSIYQ